MNSRSALALRRGLVFFFVLVIVEGAIRKWLFPQHQQLVYLLKDVWLLILMGVYVLAQKTGSIEGVRGTGAGVFLLLYIGWVVLESFNPALPSLTLGLWGIRSHILYAGLVWLVPAAFRSCEAVENWLRALPLLAIPVLSLGVAQFLSPPGSFINRYASGSNDVATFGHMGAARVSGTFPYISGMVVFVFAVALVALVLLLAGERGRRWRVWFGLTLAVVVMPMTGARSIAYVWALVLPILTWEMCTLFPAFGGRLVRILVGLAIVGLPIGIVSGEAINALAERASGSSDFDGRVRQTLVQPMDFYFDSGLVGYGAGSTHQAATALVPDRPAYDWLPTSVFEGESGRLMLELGLVGFIIVLALKLSWILLAHAALRRARTHAQFVISMTALGFFVAHFASSVVFDATAGACYWGFAGALACVVREEFAHS